MSHFPSIEEFDGGQVTATRVEDAGDAGDLLDAGTSSVLAREQAVLGDDAQFFQATSTPQGEAAFFGGGDQGFPHSHLVFSKSLMCQMKMYTSLRQVSLLLAPRYSSQLLLGYRWELTVRMDMGTRLLRPCQRHPLLDKTSPKSSSTSIISRSI